MENNIEEKDKALDKKKKFKMNGRKWGTLLSVILLCVGGIFLAKNNTVTDNTPVQFEVLDESVLTRDVFKEWLETNANKKGTYLKEDGDVVYAMISYGKTTKPGIGICVEKINGSRNTEIVYSIIDSNDEREVEEYTPKMILKLPKNSGKITFKEIQPE